MQMPDTLAVSSADLTVTVRETPSARFVSHQIIIESPVIFPEVML